VVAEAIAAAWRTPAPAARLDRDAQRRWLAGETARRALDRVRRSRAVDAVLPAASGVRSAASGPATTPEPPSATLRAIAELPPRARAAVALRFVAGESVDETAAALRLSASALRDALRPVYQRLGSPAPAAAVDRPEPPPELVWRGSVVAAEERSADPAVAAAIRAAIAGLPVRVNAAAVRAALTAPRRRWLPPWWPIGGVGGALVLAVAAWIALGGPATPPGVPTSSATSSGSPGPATRDVGAAPVTLADCRIEPQDAALAFSGWTTLEALQAPAGAGGRSNPVYVVVTRDLAEWAGGGASPAAGLPSSHAIGRMGCIYDPATGRASRVEVPLDWTPPAIADGCPAAGTDTYAGEPEIGGPRAFIVTFPSLTWTVQGGGPRTLLVRLDPVPSPASLVGAWLQPLGPGARQAGSVSQGGRTGTAATGSAGLRYYRASLPAFDAPGCWVIGFTVDGHDAGSVIVPVIRAQAAAAS
jgi:DNA-directed RNA polymerase specialized sigma24 family protein